MFRGLSSCEAKSAALRKLVKLAPRGDLAKRTLIVVSALVRLPALEPSDPDFNVVRNLIRELAGQPQFVQLAIKYGAANYVNELMQFAIDNPDVPAGIDAMRALLEAGHPQVIARRLERAEGAPQLVRVLGNAIDGSAEEIELLMSIITADTYDRATRLEAVRAAVRLRKGLARITEVAASGQFPEQFKVEAGQAISKSLYVPGREKAQQFFPLPAAKGNQQLPQMTELLTYSGDPEKGKLIFTTATCATCHKVRDVGTEFGPDLTEIGSKLAKRGLYESILDPSSGISHGYEQYLVQLADGASFPALRVSENDDSITVRVQNGGVRKLDREDVDLFERQDTSIMPAGLMQLMTVDDLVDLVEYLVTLKRG